AARRLWEPKVEPLFAAKSHHTSNCLTAAGEARSLLRRRPLRSTHRSCEDSGVDLKKRKTDLARIFRPKSRLRPSPSHRKPHRFSTGSRDLSPSTVRDLRRLFTTTTENQTYRLRLKTERKGAKGKTGVEEEESASGAPGSGGRS
ncbi:PREDICTED: uncharacterized protein LOC106321137, partial [Brassica oleracea var. oleracea]|uniref:uncharacterized protein LOC106321137 n=1 Tax=Brassica oleracea var. oleracea TaxID=109376 RepID=UPI0006A7008B